LLKNKIDCAYIYCVTLIELQVNRDDFIQNTSLETSTFSRLQGEKRWKWRLLPLEGDIFRYWRRCSVLQN